MSAGENRRWLSWYLLLFSLLTVWGTWRWANALLVPASTARALAGGRPVGNNSDLYPRWLGAREALLHHRDPYSAALTREIQAGYYGRPLDARHLADPADQQAFAYPLYVVFLLAPTVSFPFPAVMHFFSWFLLLVTAASVLLWTRALAWRPPRTIQLVIVLLTLSTYPFVQGFYKQQLTLLVGFLLAAAAAATVRGWLALAGFLLALSTIKPQISCLLVFWFLIWSTGEWKSRKSLALSFAATLAALMIAAQLLQPGWLREFASALQAYRGYAADESLLQVLLTPFGGKLATAALIIFFAAICWWWRNSLPCHSNSPGCSPFRSLSPLQSSTRPRPITRCCSFPQRCGCWQTIDVIATHAGVRKPPAFSPSRVSSGNGSPLSPWPSLPASRRFADCR